MFTPSLSRNQGKCAWQDRTNKIHFSSIIYLRTLINYEWQLISGVQGPWLSAELKSTECTVCHGLCQLTKKTLTALPIGCRFSEETSLIMCESVCSEYACACVCGAHVFDNNKASENEEELNCVSHFSFPCFSACQKKSPAFWLMAQTTKSEQQTLWLWGRKKERSMSTSMKNANFKILPNQQTKKSQYQIFCNMIEHVLKMT